MKTIRTSCNPAMLVWAREEIGYTLEQAAEATGISTSNLESAESGQRPLTLKQLTKVADKFACPLGYFYFSKPPHEKTYKPVPDYRVESGKIGINHYRLNLEIKKIRDQRETYLDLAKMLETELVNFEIQKNLKQKGIGNTIRKRLGIDDQELANLKYEKIYAYWKTKIENDGVLVYESRYIPNESGVIGVALYYDICPIILIKRGSAFNTRKLFTLLHEYAHLLMGISAINDAKGQTIEYADNEIEIIEILCNHISGEILAPSENINASDFADLELEEKMEAFAKAFKITYSTAAVRLRTVGLITSDDLTYLLDLRGRAYKEKLQQNKRKNKKVRIPSQVTMRLDLGRPMFDAVLQAYSAGALDIYDASSILRLRVKKIDKLLAE